MIREIVSWEFIDNPYDFGGFFRAEVRDEAGRQHFVHKFCGFGEAIGAREAAHDLVQRLPLKRERGLPPANWSQHGLG